MKDKSSCAVSGERTERITCPGQSYEITHQMCEARRSNSFSKCAKCRRAARLAKSA